MSGLLHLVEAATALTQLYPSEDYSASSTMSINFTSSTSQQVMSTAASTSIPAYTATTSAHQSRRASTHNISDADDDMDTSCVPKIQDHLQALRAAAVAAGLDTQPAAPPNNNNVSPTPESLSTSLASSRAFYSSIAETNKETFPMRLHAILADTSISDVVSWLPHGKAFVVLNPDVFTTQVLPRYISTENGTSSSKSSTTPKYPSFTRKLNRWGFKQVSRGGDAGAFSHDLFQRDYPELCRSMVCQKSRKAKNKIPLNGSVQSEDMMSVSSASTKSVSLGEKRPYSSTVTVSTAGGHTSSSSSSSNVRNLPLKKRKAHKHLNGDGIPSMITHRNQKMPASTTSNIDSDLASGSDSGYSNNNNVAPKSTELKNNVTLSAEASAAREALARHFHEQHRAFALATLMENSRLAMEAAGMKNAQASNQVVAPATPPQQEQKSSSQGSPTVGAITTYSPMVFAPTVSVAEDTKMPANKKTPQEDDANEKAFSAAESAKTELYSAFLQALASNGMTVKSS